MNLNGVLEQYVGASRSQRNDSRYSNIPSACYCFSILVSSSFNCNPLSSSWR